MEAKKIRFGNKKEKIRTRRKQSIRRKISGTADSPRFSIFRSNRFLYGQLIDDRKGVTLISASTKEEAYKGKSGKNKDAAVYVGEQIAKRAIEKGITTCRFDRNGYIYHGKVKVLADKAREQGLKF